MGKEIKPMEMTAAATTPVVAASKAPKAYMVDQWEAMASVSELSLASRTAEGAHQSLQAIQQANQLIQNTVGAFSALAGDCLYVFSY